MTGSGKWGASLAGGLLLTQDGMVVHANDTAAQWLGYPVHELAGLPLTAILGGGGQFFLHSQILPMLKLKGLLEEVYLRMKEKSGTTIPVLANIGYVGNEQPARIEISFVRILQRGKLEDELVQAKKMAEQANDAKTKFLGMMSHELRTPLQLVGLNHELLMEEGLGPLTREQKEILQANQEANRSVTLLVDDILNFARMQGGPVQVALETVAVGRALVRAESSIRHRLDQNGLGFRQDCSPPDLRTRADPNRLQQILINLLNNAIKFTPRGGSITLTARRQEGMVVLEVADTGCGIPEDQLQRIFEPFVQLRTTVESADKPGVGLGLAICRDLVRAMDGRISVRSVPGQGTVFSISLPVETDQK